VAACGITTPNRSQARTLPDALAVVWSRPGSASTTGTNIEERSAMSGLGESTWNEAMDRSRAALIDSERLYDDITASERRSNVDIETHLRRSEVQAAQAQAWLMPAGELGSQGERYGHRGT
jgi:hypothetical protein